MDADREAGCAARPNLLVAGIGDIFLADDGFGPAVAARLAESPLPEGVRVLDVGVQSVQLAYELLAGTYDCVIMVGAVTRGALPGTIHVIEPLLDTVPAAAALDTHAMGPAAVLSLLKSLGGALPPTIVVGCEPASMNDGLGLTETVAAVVDDGVVLVRHLIEAALVDRLPAWPRLVESSRPHGRSNFFPLS